MNRALLLHIPFCYFVVTRLSKGHPAFHVLYEWLPAVLLISWMSETGLAESALLATSGVLIFFSAYELGYLYNDKVAAAREEGAARDRLAGYAVSVPVFLFARIIVGGGLLIITCEGKEAVVRTAMLYAPLVVAMIAHNVMLNPWLRVSTFSTLSILRFWAPIIPFVETSSIIPIFPVVLMSYTFYRTLSYMESKGLLSSRRPQTAMFQVFCSLPTLAIAFLLVPSGTDSLFAAIYAFFCSCVSGIGILIKQLRRNHGVL